VATTNDTQIIDSSMVHVNTAYLYRVRASAGPSFGPYSSIDLATTVIFTDDVLTIIRVAHVTQLRTAVNAVRALAGFVDPYNFTDPTLTPGASTIRAVHITELRSALDAARSQII